MCGPGRSTPTATFPAVKICPCRGDPDRGDGARSEYPLYVHCYSGARSGRAVTALRRMGYSHVTNIGGIRDYRGKTGSWRKLSDESHHHWRGGRRRHGGGSDSPVGREGGDCHPGAFGVCLLCQLRPALLHRRVITDPEELTCRRPRGFGTASGWTCGYATRPPPLTRRASRSRSRT